MKSVQYRFGEFRLVSATRQAWRNGEPIRLPRRVFDCIVYLLENRERAIGRDELVAAIWGRVDVADTQLSQLMRRVRRALGDDGHSQRSIETVQGFGYRWAMEAEAEPTPGGADAAGAQAGPASGAAIAPRGEHAAAPWSRVAMPSEPGHRGVRRRRGWLLAAIGALLAVLVAAVAWKAGSRPTPRAESSDARVVVLPIEVSGPAESAWVRLGAMDVVAERLRMSGLVVPPSESILATLHGATSADQDARVRDVFGARTAVRGTAVRSAAGWQVSLEARSGDVLQRVAEASATDAVQAGRAAAGRLAAAMGQAPASDPGEGETLAGRIARVRAALLANEIGTARELLATEGTVDDDPVALRYWRARTDFLAGDLEPARAAFDELLARDAVRNDAMMHGRVLIGRAGVDIRRADYAAAERDFDAAVARLRAFEASPEYAEALAGRGIARVALRRFDAAAGDLGEARLRMELAGDAYGTTRVDANLGLFEMVRRRPAAALPYLRGAAERFAQFGAISALLSTLNAQFDAHADLLQWREAFAVTERRLALRDRAVDPMQRYLIGVDQSRALTALGRHREAARALDAAENEFPDMRDALRQVLHAQRADLAWRRGDAANALAAARAGLADAPCTETSAPCDTLVLAYQRTLVALGEAGNDPVAPAIRVLSEPGAEVLAGPVAQLAQAEWDAHRGDFPAAERHYANARAAVEHDGTPGDVARVADSQARWLVERGRHEEAASVAGRVAAWATQDFDCALLQVVVLRAYGRIEPWAAALRRARSLAGERTIPDELSLPPG